MIRSSIALTSLSKVVVALGLGLLGTGSASIGPLQKHHRGGLLESPIAQESASEAAGAEGPVVAGMAVRRFGPDVGQGIAPPMGAVTLLPNWLNSQGSALELAQPVGRWLSALNPLAHQAASLKAGVPQSGSGKLPDVFVCAQDPAQRYELFSEWVYTCLLREVNDPALRQSMTERIEATFRHSVWGDEAVVPTLAENFPAARLGDRLLFVANEEVTEAAGINGEVLTTRWVNQLRMITGGQPLTLVDAQFMMHGLVSTGDYLQGEASWYGPYFHGRLTATGEIYDQDMFTAAHKELPFDTYLRITNLKSGEQLVVRINDRGPYVGDRILDLSYGAANYLGSKDTGVVSVRAEFLERNEPLQAQLPTSRSSKSALSSLITTRRP